MSREEELLRSLRYDDDDPSHDLAHILRVAHSCRAIAREEGGDLDLLIPAVYLHDLINLPKNHPKRAEAGDLSARAAAPMLDRAGYSADEIDPICTVIREHGYSSGRAPSTLEAAILQDADRLDAIGAIGVMRAVTTGVRLGARYYHLEEPFADERPLDDRRFTIDHFFTKLLRLESTMNTKTGEREARRRVEFMRTFLDQLAREIPSDGH